MHYLLVLSPHQAEQSFKIEIDPGSLFMTSGPVKPPPLHSPCPWPPTPYSMYSRLGYPCEYWLKLMTYPGVNTIIFQLTIPIENQYHSPNTRQLPSVLTHPIPGYPFECRLRRWWNDSWIQHCHPQAPFSNRATPPPDCYPSLTPSMTSDPMQ